MHDPFDIAPYAPRHTTSAWIVLAIAVAFGLLSAVHVGNTWMRSQAAEAHLADVRQELVAHTRKHTAASAGALDTPVEVVQGKLELQRVLNISWSGMFEVLESATKVTEGRATVTALAPVRLRPEGAEVGVAGLAVSSPVMLDYLRALENQPGVKEVQLVQQEPATLGGTSVVRFQALFLLDGPASSTSMPPSVPGPIARRAE